MRRGEIIGPVVGEPMNNIRISGVLATHVEVGRTERGINLAKTRLRYSDADDSVPVSCVGQQADLLSQLQIGEQVFVSGRLVARGVGRRVGILADRIEVANPKMRDAQAEADFFYSMKAHAQNARVPGR
jgi:cytochrome c-type biogenesis protein CcmE